MQREKSASPKRSPKPGRHNDTEIKDYGPIDGDKKYPPHAYSRSNSGISLKHTNISSETSGASQSNNGHVNLKNGASQSKNGHSNRTNGDSPSQKLRMSSLAGSGVSGIPSPRAKPPAPPDRAVESRRSSGGGSELVNETLTELTVGEKSVSSDSGTKDDHTEINAKSERLSEHCVSRSCSLPRQKRMGDCPSQVNVAVVSPMPHMTKSASVSETGSRKQCCNSQEGQENGDDALRGKLNVNVVLLFSKVFDDHFKRRIARI